MFYVGAQQDPTVPEAPLAGPQRRHFGDAQHASHLDTGLAPQPGTCRPEAPPHVAAPHKADTLVIGGIDANREERWMSSARAAQCAVLQAQYSGQDPALTATSSRLRGGKKQVHDNINFQHEHFTNHEQPWLLAASPASQRSQPFLGQPRLYTTGPDDNTDMLAGTTKAAGHIPGYTGFIAANSDAGQQGGEQQPRSINKDLLMENYRTTMPGCTKHTPRR
ncbi:hypothetical protein WJX72_001666 [[Myrmecia] bisecta]|uniref:Uncharacterized protein n=1 Tax=[Myrmecia] bisecta TaxID=41462 RepID=A0AAW1PNH6_9CHLO